MSATDTFRIPFDTCPCRFERRRRPPEAQPSNRHSYFKFWGFIIDEKTTQPSQDNSIDFSKCAFNESIYEKAINFLEGRDKSLYFEIVCSG